MISKIRSENEFMNFVDKSKFQAFLFSSRVGMPYFFARHPWIVLNEKGELTRYEVMLKAKPNGSHVYKRIRNFSVALKKYNRVDSPYWKKSCLLFKVEGESARKLIDFMKNVEEEYPFSKEYNMSSGPNSNSFVGWILHENKYLGWKLSWRHFGRNWYRKLKFI